ncbi:glycosyltransferase family 4 protein [Porticoccaceae bacterium]|nr:glycosyltransferase family 4 protein [Porticoccaceae bacterium]
MIHYITSTGVGNAWVGNELMALAKQDIPFVLHSLHRPKSTFFKSDEVAAINAGTHIIYPQSAWAVFCAVCSGPFLFGGSFWFALLNSFFGRKESFVVRLKSILHFAVACHWAKSLMGSDVSHIHSQWINSCGTVGMYGAWLLNKPFSFTGHAADLFRERCALKDKIARAKFIVCISSFHRDFYLSEGAELSQLVIVYCGIDTSLFKPVTRPVAQAGQPIRIISSARLVEKKGLCYLIDACSLLNANNMSFTCTIGGDGPLLDELQRQVNHAGLAEKVFFTGQPLLQEDIPGFMETGDIYCLPCVWASDGDVDGLPQMLMEAMACGIPVISTDLVGMPDLIKQGHSGLLVESENPRALAEAIRRLAEDETLRETLAMEGREKVIRTFDISVCLQPLLSKFKQALSSTIEHSNKKTSSKTTNETTNETTKQGQL